MMDFKSDTIAYSYHVKVNSVMNYHYNIFRQLLVIIFIIIIFKQKLIHNSQTAFYITLFYFATKQ